MKTFLNKMTTKTLAAPVLALGLAVSPIAAQCSGGGGPTKTVEHLIGSNIRTKACAGEITGFTFAGTHPTCRAVWNCVRKGEPRVIVVTTTKYANGAMASGYTRGSCN